MITCKRHPGYSLDVERIEYKLFLYCSACHSIVLYGFVDESVNQPPNMLWRLDDGSETLKAGTKEKEQETKEQLQQANN